MSVTKKVLSIQSSVVYGHVGNRSAVFPLELLGFDVCPFNTVQLSTHTHYPTIGGDATKPDHAADICGELQRVWQAMRACGIDTHLDLVLTGYCGSAELLAEIARIIGDIREVKKQKNVIYVCDPAFGDFGKFYHPSFVSLVAPYRDLLVPLATIFVPNQFELEQISGVSSITTETELWRAVEAIASPNVVVTSTSLSPDGRLWLYCRQTLPDKSITKHKFSVPKIPVDFVGTGDIFAALLLAHFDKHEGDLRKALELTLRSMRALLLKTHDKIKKMCPTGEPEMWQKELCLVESKTLIESPPIEDSIVCESIQ